MQKEIFDLLVDISNNGFINVERQGNITSTEQRILEAEKLDKLDYLLSQGLVSSSSRYIFIITELGYEVSKHLSWVDYVTYQKEIRDRKIKKDSIDLKISEFQVRTKFLPYIISFLSILIAIFDPFDFKKETNEIQEQNIHKPLKNIQIDTNSHTSKDRLDTAAQYNHIPLK